MRRSRNLLRWALFLTAAPILFLGALWPWRESVKATLRADVAARVEVLQGELLARDPRRPPLFGTALPGDAWTDYLPALRLVEALPAQDQRTLWGDRWGPQRPYDLDTIRPIMTKGEPILAGLLQGSRRSEARCLIDWNRYTRERLRFVGNSLGYFGVAAARFNAEDGRPLEAARLLLAAAQLGRDGAIHGDGNAVDWAGSLHFFCWEAKSILQERKLSGEAALMLAQGLEILDGSLPGVENALRIDRFRWGLFVLAGYPGMRGSSGDSWPSWRQLYSSEIMELNGFLNIDHWFKEGAEAEAKPWSEARQIWDGLERESWTRKNMASQGVPEIYGTSRRYRDLKARLNLVRAACRYTASGIVAPVPDPYGDELRSKADGVEMLFWSLGRNGADDGGFETPDHNADLILRVPLHQAR